MVVIDFMIHFLFLRDMVVTQRIGRSCNRGCGWEFMSIIGSVPMIGTVFLTGATQFIINFRFGIRNTLVSPIFVIFPVNAGTN